MLLSLLINGCGSGNHASATSTAPPATKTTTGTGGRPPAAAHSRGAGRPATPAVSASNVRLPASFVISAPRSLSPATVAAPAGVAIQLSVVSRDRRRHQFALRTTPPRALTVPAGGGVSILISGLKAGRYELYVDGARAGSLDVGAKPGP